jgi:hypothetical protein
MDQKVLDLIARGYFPSELPPPFNTDLLATKLNSVAPSWAAEAEIETRGKRLGMPIRTEGEHYSMVRVGHSRRTMYLPHPINQFYLARAIVERFDKIQAHFGKSKISQSIPNFAVAPSRAVEITQQQDLANKRLLLASGSRFVLRTDISRFYPSIYTHSIPWALHGKTQSKKDQDPFSEETWGNKIDAMLRQCQDGQTIGIPIGPDTSRLIGEIISVGIDLKLPSIERSDVTGLRHVDDYFLCFDNQSDATSALTELERALQDFQLEINAAKTAIVDSKENHEPHWLLALRSVELSRELKNQDYELSTLFETALDLARENESAIVYALKKSVSSTIVSKENYEKYAAYVMKLALASPNALRQACLILISYKYLGFELNDKYLTRFVNNVIVEHSPSDHHSEIAWALWLAIEFKLKIGDQAAALVSQVKSSVCALLALAHRQSGLVSEKLDVTLWEKLVAETWPKGSFWLLGYEAVRRGWIRSIQVSQLEQSSEFGVLHREDVSFFDINRKAPQLIKLRGESTTLDEIFARLFEDETPASEFFEFIQAKQAYGD